MSDIPRPARVLEVRRSRNQRPARSLAQRMDVWARLRDLQVPDDEARRLADFWEGM